MTCLENVPYHLRPRKFLKRKICILAIWSHYVFFWLKRDMKFHFKAFNCSLPVVSVDFYKTPASCYQGRDWGNRISIPPLSRQKEVVSDSGPLITTPRAQTNWKETFLTQKFKFVFLSFCNWVHIWRLTDLSSSAAISTSGMCENFRLIVYQAM